MFCVIRICVTKINCFVPRVLFTRTQMAQSDTRDGLMNLLSRQIQSAEQSRESNGMFGSNLINVTQSLFDAFT